MMQSVSIINSSRLLVLFFTQKALKNNKITCLLKPLTLSSLMRFYNCCIMIGLVCNCNFRTSMDLINA
jgi:hypothetical protein